MNKWEKEVQRSLLDSEEAAITELEKQYKKALKDINEKVKLFDSDIKLLQEAINADGLDDAAREVLISQQRSKVYQKQYQQALQGQVSGILDNLHGTEYATIDKYLKECYTNGYVGTMYDIAKQGVPVIMPIDQAAVVKAVLTDSKVSKGLYNALGVNVKKLKKTITQEVSRGIATGLSYSDIARNISNAAKAPLSRAKTIARTEGHRIQVTSTADAQQAAKAKGADVVKQWDAALDGKTRDSHRRVDGEIRELDEKFSNGLMQPGDSAGGAAEVVNCRCALLTRARWALDEDELKTLEDRAKYFGLDKTENFDDFKEKYLEAANKMASESEDNDWSKTTARAITSAEKQKVVKHATDKGIEIGDIDSFDGDIELLKVEIDTVSRTCKDYGIKNKVTISSRVLEDDGDFAVTKGYEIIFNSKALRNREITEYNITNTTKFASRSVEDIALHEAAHIFVKEKDVNSLEIAKKAYYNVTGKYVSTKFLNSYLLKEVSYYSSTKKEEIVSEVIVKNKNKPTEFTKEFVSLLKGAVS